MSMKDKENSKKQILISNRKASRNYVIIEKFEAGLVLTGSEVKSIKLKHASIQEGYIQIDKNLEVWLINCSVQPYISSIITSHNVDREKKLLLKRNEIEKLNSKVKEKGFSIIPLSYYLLKGKIKIEIALCQGKDLFDKREAIKKRESQRNIKRVIKNYNN
jgi:SsrA-binding protein